MSRFQRFKQKWNRDDGVSIVVALIVLLAVTLACTTLFYTINSSIRNAGQGRDREQAMLLAQSLSQEVQAEVAKAENRGKPDTIAGYLYRYFSVYGPGSLPYYVPGDPLKGKKEDMTTTFTREINQSGGTDPLNATVSVSLYWSTTSITYGVIADNFSTNGYQGNDFELYVTTTVTVKSKTGGLDQSASVVSVFNFSETTDTSVLIEGVSKNANFWWTYDGSV